MIVLDTFKDADGVWEVVEDSDRDGLCRRCGEHSSPVYLRLLGSEDLEDAESSCCSAGITLY